jgi:hypothetical protein
MPTAHLVHWPGTAQERLALLDALRAHCTCVRDAQGTLLEVCSPHHMLVHDQRAVNGLLVYRHLAERLRREEHMAAASS